MQEEQIQDIKATRNPVRGSRLRKTIIRKIGSMPEDDIKYLENFDDEKVEKALDMNILQELVGLKPIKVLRENVVKLRNGDKNYTQRLGQANTRKLYFGALTLQYAFKQHNEVLLEEKIEEFINALSVQDKEAEAEIVTNKMANSYKKLFEYIG